MTAIECVARTCVHVDRESLCVNAVIAIAVVTASLLHIYYGSFARALAAFGLSPAI